MVKLHYTTDYPILRYTQTILRKAVRRVWPDEEVEMDLPTKKKHKALRFGIDTPSPKDWGRTPNIERKLSAALRKHVGLPPEPMRAPLPNGDKVLYLDTETHSADERWNLHPDEFTRLVQYAWGPTGEVHLALTRQEAIDLIEQADLVVAHNGHAFDWSTIYGPDSTRPLELALEGRLFDTMVYANIAFPAPVRYTTREGRDVYVTGPGTIQKWLGLDNLAYQLGVEGKLGDLRDMAKRYGGFCHIPLVLTEFIDYAKQDIVTLQQVTHELLVVKPIEDYDWREQINAAIDAQNSRNGFRVDVSAAQQRIEDLTHRRAEILEILVKKYGFPTVGKSPWASSAGKEAIMKALKSYGITPENCPDWKQTKTGYSLGGDELKRLALGKGNEAENFCQLLAEIKGQRTLPQQALDSLQNDGSVHPDITALQRSGRKSTTNPALTIWGAREGRDVDKAYFIPDSGDHVLMEFDYSNADQRVVAAYSGDTVYLERMEEGFDGHEMSGRFLFGDKIYDSDPKYYRQVAKPAGHGWAYRASWRAVQRGTGCTQEQATNFLDGMNSRYADVVSWQDLMSAAGEMGYLYNDWGRRMIVESGRSYTQSPALMGQSGTREIMVDALIKMATLDMTLIQCLKAQVHDALVFSFLETEVDMRVEQVLTCMEVTWQPRDGSGQAIHFPVSYGQPASDWQKAGH
jgi:DNA polymerase-1